jgi:His-Xaa-Ser system protein HxsD
MVKQLIINKSIYSLVTIKKAAYRFIKVFSISFSESSDSYICDMSFPDKYNEEHVDFYIDDFNKEILDQDLRERIKKETEPVRNLILSHAFSKTDLS